MAFAIRSSPVRPNGQTGRRFLTRGRLAMILAAYVAFNFGSYYGASFKEDMRFWRTVINIVTATFER